MDLDLNLMEDDEDDKMEDENGSSTDYSNFSNDDTLMDTGDDGVEEIRFGTEKVNEYNKRVRLNEFTMETLLEEEDVDKMTPFQESPKFPLHRLKPFSNDLSQLPGYKKPTEHFNPFATRNNRPFITDEETQKKYKQWKYNQDKEEIRQIIRLNKFNKQKAVEEEKKINLIGQREFGVNLFTSGKESNYRKYRR